MTHMTFEVCKALVLAEGPILTFLCHAELGVGRVICLDGGAFLFGIQAKASC